MNLNQWEKVKIAFWLSDHEFSSLIFYLLLFLLPTQFGRHFWFPFSYIHGLRLDYLSPTVYVSDVLLLLLFLHSVVTVVKKRLSIRDVLWASVPVPFLDRRLPRLVFLLLGSLFIGLNCYFAVTPLATLYGWVKASEIIFFSCYAFYLCKSELDMYRAIRIFLLGVTLQAVLGISQFVSGGSLGGFWYYIGERMFHGDTPGIANASIFGELVLRPYGTLPHPNVLAAYLLIALAFLLFVPKLFSWKYGRFLSVGLFFLFTCTLFMTFSRTALLLFPVMLFIFLSKIFSKRKAIGILVASVLPILIFLPSLIGRFETITRTNDAVTSREFLFHASLEIIRTHQFFGTGLYGFLPVLGKTFPTLPFDLLQPVHVLILLIAAELGVPFAMCITATTLYLSILCIKRNAIVSLMLLLLVIMLGATDHYFWTLQQGQLLLGFSVAIIIHFALKSSNQLANSTILKAKKRKI